MSLGWLTRDLAPNHWTADGFDYRQALALHGDFVGPGHIRESLKAYGLQGFQYTGAIPATGQVFGAADRELQAALWKIAGDIAHEQKFINATDSRDTFILAEPGGYPLVGTQPYIAASVVATWGVDSEPHKRLGNGEVARAGWLAFVQDGSVETPSWISQPYTLITPEGGASTAVWVYVHPGATMQVSLIKEFKPQVSMQLLDEGDTLFFWEDFEAD